MTIEKDGLRARFKRKLNELPSTEKRRQSQALVSKLAEYLADQSGVWTIYSPLNDEPNLLTLLQRFDQITWVFPKIESKEQMQFYKAMTPEQMLSDLFLESVEPESDEAHRVETHEIAGFIVPGLAFDKNGIRLGRGGGYYDRYLENYKGPKLGVTFNEGIATEALPREPHDQQMNIVISPEAWIEVDKSEVSNEF